MSEMEKCEGISRYESMSTEELQEILRKHAHGELDTEPTTEELFEIMEVLSDRRQQQDTQAFRSDEEALAEFRQHYMPKDEERAKPGTIQFPNRAFRAVAAVLAVVIVLAVGTSITAKALRIDLWSKLATWTKEIFQFSDVQPTEPEKEYNPELKSLQDALNDHKIQEKIAPTWMPDGYANKDLRVVDSPKVLNISATYEKNDEKLIIKIRQTIGVQASQTEKNDDFLEVYVVDGIEYYIFSNTETLQVAWSLGEFECVISGKITLEEMKMMIDSISK